MARYVKYNPEIARIKQRNVEIFNETTSIINKGNYKTPLGKNVEIDVAPMINGSECYHQEQPVSSAGTISGETKVIVENNDCLKAAQRLQKEGYSVALLNFASLRHPGGGVETGARAQEETICRRSTLTRSIYSFDQGYSNKYRYGFIEKGYPMADLKFSLIYSPSVTVFREGVNDDYLLMEEPFNVAVVTCAALNLSGKFDLKLDENGHMTDEIKDVMYNKIKAIFRVSLSHGHDALVLGAFGCGAFKNPPEEVAQIFKDVINDSEFRNKYRLITFSIIEDHNSNGANLAAFKQVFKVTD